MLPRTRPKRPWLPWARAGISVAVIALAGWGLMELGTRYLGLQKLVIEQVNVSGCRGERQAEVQKLAEQLVLGKPLFWVDAEDLRARIEAKRWVQACRSAGPTGPPQP
ncbi:MAG: FtsQ-type POTRA domain-containing protein [Holophagaceae bacterium]|uniref:FtsQ-type POTRA domain-containing protein n=1 Tax=Candidatus Geothrix odensensis TaxID=2954440 RepID=A0A936F4P1_9BACT|nr:FtsQ-type POTRA domain-containing protein [Candidatus Geothrix odensensis]